MEDEEEELGVMGGQGGKEERDRGEGEKERLSLIQKR